MSKFIETRDQARAAEKVIDRLEKKVKAGTATEEETVRYRSGLEYLLCWEWEQEGKRIKHKPLKANDGKPKQPVAKIPVAIGKPGSVLGGLRAGSSGAVRSVATEAQSG